MGSTLCLRVCLHHAAYNRSQFPFDGEEALEEGGGSLDASALIRRVGLEIVAIFGVKTEAVVVVISFHSHLFPELYRVLVAEIRQLAAPLQNYHHFFYHSLQLPLRLLSAIHNLQLQFSSEALEVSALL